jgi:hypothetical protein
MFSKFNKLKNNNEEKEILGNGAGRPITSLNGQKRERKIIFLLNEEELELFEENIKNSIFKSKSDYIRDKILKGN